MRLLSRKAMALALVAGIAVSTSAVATNGYFLIGYGAKSRSMGGTGVANGQDGLAAAANPAAMVDVGTRADMGVEYFRPKRGFVHDSATLESGFPGAETGVNHRSGSNNFLIPSAGAVYQFNDRMTFGMAVIGNGANTRFNQQVPGIDSCLDGNTSDGVGSTAYNFNCLGSKTVGVSLLQMQMLPSIAYRVTSNHTLGASLAIGIQQFRAYGLQSFLELGFSAGTKNLTNNGNDYSYGAGARVGYQGKFFNNMLTLGANYATKVYMSKFDKYEDLFAQEGRFDIPAHWTVGFAIKPHKKWTIAGDVQRIYYGDVKSVANLGPQASNPNSFFPPGTDVTGKHNGLGFGWNDQNVYKIGVNFDYSKKLSFRAGYNYGESQFDSDQVLFNFLAPAVNQHHLTLGASYRHGKHHEFSASYMHAFKNTVKGPTVFGPESGLPVHGSNASIDMRINAFGVSYGYKF